MVKTEQNFTIIYPNLAPENLFGGLISPKYV